MFFVFSLGGRGIIYKNIYNNFLKYLLLYIILIYNMGEKRDMVRLRRELVRVKKRNGASKKEKWCEVKRERKQNLFFY